MLRYDLTEEDEANVVAVLIDNASPAPNNGEEMENVHVGDAPLQLNLDAPPVLEAPPPAPVIPPAPPAVPPPPLIPINPLLMPNGVDWEEIEGVTEEKYANRFGKRSTIHMNRTRDYGVENVVEYFYAMFPMAELENMVGGTNVELAIRKKPPTSRGEMLKFIGIRLASVLERRRGTTRSWFKDGGTPGSIHVEGNYSKRFGMAVTQRASNSGSARNSESSRFYFHLIYLEQSFSKTT